MTMFKLFQLFVLGLVFSVVHGNVNLELSLKLGRIKGHRLSTRNGREFSAFQGIPYAKPPVGKLRFKSPEPAEPWTGLRDATVEGSVCIQRDLYTSEEMVKGHEDCLFLNVYTPNIASNDSVLLPVMFWIHGGGWFSGSSSAVPYGANYLLDKDVIVVTINYRLGPLGFLSTGDSVVPGNNGLKDQVLALEWVRDNIEQFGGNPGKVTIFGQSAGGASVHFHTLSPLSKGLFHGAIAHSGTVLGPWAFAPIEIGKSYATKLGTILNCTTNSSTELVDCLRTQDASAIISTDSFFKEWNMDPVTIFRPVVEGNIEGAFITDDPIKLLEDPTKVASVPFIAGLTSGDGAINVASIFYKPSLLEELNDNFTQLAPLTMFYRETSPDPQNVTRQIRDFYFGDKPITNESKYTVVDMYTDAYTLHSVGESVRLHANASAVPVYYFYFDYKPPVSFTTLFGDPSGTDYGVCHDDDLQFLFPHDKLFPDGKLEERDFKMVDTLTTLWTEFARTGNPTPPGHVLEHWNPVETAEVEYLHISREGKLSMHKSLLAERAHFWASLPLTNNTQ